jgi:hypothetical protein
MSCAVIHPTDGYRYVRGKDIRAFFGAKADNMVGYCFVVYDDR